MKRPGRGLSGGQRKNGAIRKRNSNGSDAWEVGYRPIKNGEDLGDMFRGRKGFCREWRHGSCRKIRNTLTPLGWLART